MSKAKRKPLAEHRSEAMKRKSVKETKIIVAEIAMMSAAAAEISAQDCAAFSVLAFNEGEVDPPWKELGAKAVGKFMRFGWAAFHAFGGLNADWAEVHKRISGKLQSTRPKRKVR